MKSTRMFETPYHRLANVELKRYPSPLSELLKIEHLLSLFTCKNIMVVVYTLFFQLGTFMLNNSPLTSSRQGQLVHTSWPAPSSLY
jgi:hypothetical protein